MRSPPTGHRSAGGLLPRLLSPRGRTGRPPRPPASTRPSSWAIRSLVHPGLFWVPQRTKASRPFRTSMLARLPWRVVAGALALATGTAAGACFALANLLWAVGDVAIGALDRSRAAPRNRRPRPRIEPAPGLISRGSCGCP